MRRLGAAFAGALLVAALASLLACGGATPARPPLVVLISLDTLRRDALPAFDPAAAPLPHLDAFAAESVRFERATSVASWTLPSHASMLTGVYPDRHGATDRRVTIAAEVPMLAERLREAGFETIGITGGGYLDDKYGFGRGFDAYDDKPPRALHREDAERSVFDRAAEIVATRTDPRPLFLFLQTYAVHDYFLLRPWIVEEIGANPSRTAPEYLACTQGARRCDDAEWDLLRRLYAAELRAVDARFGRLRAALERAGLWDAAVVVVTSDHGEGFDPARHRVGHGGRLHEDVVRIPFLVRGPGFAARAVATPVSLVDVTPTLLELAGAAQPPDLDGRSLAAVLRGAPGDAAEPTHFAVEHQSAWWVEAKTKAVSVQARPLAIATIAGDRWYLRVRDREELYDMASDPRQERDLAASAPDLEALRSASRARDVDRADSPHLESSRELEARLRALGYVE